MPRIFLGFIVAVFMSATLLSAQSFSPGLKAGFDLASMYGDDVPVTDKSILGGLTGGFFLRFNLNKFVGIQPEVLYAQKGVEYEFTDDDYIVNRMHYVEIPVQCMLYIPPTKFLSAYISFGPYTGILVEATSKMHLSFFENEKVITTEEFSRVDFGVSFGVGSVFDIGTGDVIFDIRCNLGLRSIDVASEEKDRRTISVAITFGYAFKQPMFVGTRTENLQRDDASYLRFVGSIDSVGIEVDGGPRFPVKSSDTNYKLPPGKHQIKAFRGSQMIMHREIYIGNTETKEVTIQ